MIYLIHFNKPLHHARHYIGYTKSAKSLPDRLATHRAGDGARILRALNEHGIHYEIVRTWTGDRKLERKLKKQKNSGRMCPVCQKERTRKGDV